jgi:C-terminal processing protease CtpA/Prc
VLRIKSVQPDSPAALLELQPGDLLLATTLSDGFRTRDYRLDSLTAFADLLRQAESRGQGLRLVVLRGTEDLVGTLDVSRRKH